MNSPKRHDIYKSMLYNENLKHLDIIGSWWVDIPFTDPILTMISRLTKLHIHLGEKLSPFTFDRVRMLLATMKSAENRLVIHQKIQCEQFLSDDYRYEYHMKPPVEVHLAPWLRLAVEAETVIEIRLTNVWRGCFTDEIHRLQKLHAWFVFDDKDSCVTSTFNFHFNNAGAIAGLDVCSQSGGRLIVRRD